jgi:glycosyltransferase involved in cell wall biosynthesis
MRIGLIVPGFSSDENDWCIPALLHLARALAARHEVHVFALHYPYRRERYFVFDACVHAMGGANRRGWRLPAILNAAANEVAREHRQNPFDALHAFWVYEPGVIAAWLKRRLGVRVIVTVAGGELVRLPALAYGLAGRRWLLRLMRWAMRQADVVTAGSSGLLGVVRSVTSHDAGRTAFAPLGVDTVMFHSAGRRPETPTVLVNVGALQAVKGHADLLRAFRFVVDREPNVTLRIAGVGELRAELETLSAELNLYDRVQFVGEVRHDQLPDVYRRATMFVQASYHEAQGMAVLEAAACGLPIVGTRVGALADLAPDAAVATPPGDPIRLGQNILTVLSDAASLQALGHAAQDCAQKIYSLEASVARFESLYGLDL